jgi:hypothetical protein
VIILQSFNRLDVIRMRIVIRMNNLTRSHVVVPDDKIIAC